MMNLAYYWFGCALFEHEFDCLFLYSVLCVLLHIFLVDWFIFVLWFSFFCFAFSVSSLVLVSKIWSHEYQYPLIHMSLSVEGV